MVAPVNPPIRYSKRRNSPTIPMVTHRLNLGFGDIEKVEMPKYGPKSSKEIFLLLIKEFRNMINSYGLLTTEPIERIFTRFRSCLIGSARDEWDDIAISVPRSWKGFQLATSEFMDEIVGADAYSDQQQYMRLTTKPEDLTVDQWIQQIRHMNNSLPLLDTTGENGKLTELGLIQYVVSPNIQENWITQFQINKGHKETTLKGVLPLLMELEGMDKRRRKRANKQSKSSNSSSTNDSSNHQTSQNGNKQKKKSSSSSQKREEHPILVD